AVPETRMSASRMEQGDELGSFMPCIVNHLGGEALDQDRSILLRAYPGLVLDAGRAPVYPCTPRPTPDFQSCAHVHDPPVPACWRKSRYCVFRWPRYLCRPVVDETKGRPPLCLYRQSRAARRAGL